MPDKPTIRLKQRPRRRRPTSEGTLSPTARRALIQALVFGGLVIAVVLAVFSLRPYLRDSRIRKRLSEANQDYRHGKAETAIEKYRLIEEQYPSSDIAREAATHRRDIEPYVEAAATMKREADDVFREQDYEEALKLYTEVAERFPLSLKGASAKASIPVCTRLACERHDELALTAEDAKHWDEALTQYRRIVELDPDFPHAQEGVKTATEKMTRFNEIMQRGKAEEEQKQWAEARRQYDLALEILPDNIEAFEGRARVLVQMPSPPGMVFLAPCREFVMSSEEETSSEKPQRTVRLYGFHMDIHEVTNAAYSDFVTATGRTPPPHWGGNASPPEIAELPVVCVSWHDATAYAAWAGKRLPTEAEWERAAQGTHGRAYPWGDDFRGAGQLFAGQLAPVGTAPMDRTPEGCFDMAGNVSEWTASAAPKPEPIPRKRAVARQPNRDRPPGSPSGRASPGRLSDRDRPRGSPPGLAYRGRLSERDRRPGSLPVQTPSAAEPVAGRKMIRGASWAGLEAHRSFRVIPQANASRTGDPLKTVLVDHPEIWGIEVFGLADTQFLLRGVANDIPVIEIRKWLSSEEKYVSERFLIRPGEAIEGEREVHMIEDGVRTSLTVDYHTGCTLLELVEANDPAETKIRYVDSNGIEHLMKRQPRDADLPLQREEPCTISEDILKELSQRPLADMARTSNRLSAPSTARFVNCRFRCVKDP